jgi:hypothetical protein
MQRANTKITYHPTKWEPPSGRDRPESAKSAFVDSA